MELTVVTPALLDYIRSVYRLSWDGIHGFPTGKECMKMAFFSQSARERISA